MPMSNRFRPIILVALVSIFSGCLKDKTTERECFIPCITDRTWTEADYPNQGDRRNYCEIRLNSDCTYTLQTVQDCKVVETGTWAFTKDRRPLLTGPQFPGDFIGTISFSVIEVRPFGGKDRQFYHYWELRACDGDRLEVYEFWEIEDCACYHSGDFPTRYFE